MENEEEWNSFKARVDHIEKIVRGLSSDDKIENEVALMKANEYLLTKEIADECNHQLYVKANRTVINQKAFDSLGRESQGSMSQEEWMRSVEVDAKKRAEERRLNKEESDRLLKRGNEAFRKGEYEAALSSYNKAIDKTRDSCVLYTNRALTYIRLGLYQRALNDAEMALRVNPTSTKGLVYKAQALYLKGEVQECDRVIREATEKVPDQADYIRELRASWADGGCS